MKVKVFKILSVSVLFLIIVSFGTAVEKTVETVTDPLPSAYTFGVSENDPPCLRMYEAIEKYAEMYDIPKRFL